MLALWDELRQHPNICMMSPEWVICENPRATQNSGMLDPEEQFQNLTELRVLLVEALASGPEDSRPRFRELLDMVEDELIELMPYVHRVG